MTMAMPPPVVSWFFLLLLREIDIEDTFGKKDIQYETYNFTVNLDNDFCLVQQCIRSSTAPLGISLVYTMNNLA